MSFDHISNRLVHSLPPAYFTIPVISLYLRFTDANRSSNLCTHLPQSSSGMTIKANNISKRIDDRWVLRDLTFEAENGDVFGVLGYNDSGKTLLLRILAGLENSDGGEVVLTNGGRPASLCRYVPGIETATRSFIFSRPRQESPTRRIKRILESLEDESPVVLLDGVFDGLDPENARRLRSELKQRSSRKIFIVSGSDRRQIYLTCNRIGILHGGAFVQTGSPEDVYRAPANAAAAGLTGYVNLIPARRLSSSKNDTHEFATIRGEHRIRIGNTDKASLAPINQTALLTIRPEEVSISFGASFPEDNLLKATVRDVAFLGPVTKVSLDSNGLEIEALVLRLVGLNIGDECMVGMPPDRIKILKD